MRVSHLTPPPPLPFTPSDTPSCMNTSSPNLWNEIHYPRTNAIMWRQKAPETTIPNKQEKTYSTKMIQHCVFWRTNCSVASAPVHGLHYIGNYSSGLELGLIAWFEADGENEGRRGIDGSTMKTGQLPMHSTHMLLPLP